MRKRERVYLDPIREGPGWYEKTEGQGSFSIRGEAPLLPIHQSVTTWGVFHQPRMAADEYERRKAERSLDRALVDRAQDVTASRHRRKS